MQAQAVYSEILHRQPEAKAQKLDVIVHSDFPKYHVLETSVRVFWLVFFCPCTSACFINSSYISHANTPEREKTEM